MRSPVYCAIFPIMNGTTAPPAMPVHIIPAKVPWCFGTEFSPREKIMGYITDIINPQTGKAIMATSLPAVNPSNRVIMAPEAKTSSTFLLSKTFSKTQQATYRHQAPEPGNYIGTLGLRINSVISLQKF